MTEGEGEDGFGDGALKSFSNASRLLSCRAERVRESERLSNGGRTGLRVFFEEGAEFVLACSRWCGVSTECYSHRIEVAHTLEKRENTSQVIVEKEAEAMDDL